MRNPDVLLGCPWMSSAVYDTVVVSASSADREMMPQGKTFCSLSSFLSLCLSLSFSAIIPFCWSASPLSLSFTLLHLLTLLHPLACHTSHLFCSRRSVLSSLTFFFTRLPLFCFYLYCSPRHSYHIICSERQGWSDQWQVVQGHVGVGSRTSAPIPALTLKLPLFLFSTHSHTHKHTHTHTYTHAASLMGLVKCQQKN